jgi:hypothetical protein
MASGTFRWAYEEWAAWYDRARGGQPMLHVYGGCGMPSEGYRLVLSRRGTARNGDGDLELKLGVEPPRDVEPLTIRWTEARYSEAAGRRFDTVSIFDAETGDPVRLGIPVEEVSSARIS